MKTWSKTIFFAALVLLASLIYNVFFDLPFDDMNFEDKYWKESPYFYRMSLDYSKNILKYKIGQDKRSVMRFTGKEYFDENFNLSQINHFEKPYFTDLSNEKYKLIKSTCAITLYESILKGVNFSILVLCFDTNDRFLGSFILVG